MMAIRMISDAATRALEGVGAVPDSVADAQLRAYARAKLGRVHWAGDGIVSAGIESCDTFHGAAGYQKNYANMFRRSGAAKSGQRFVNFGTVSIEK